MSSLAWLHCNKCFDVKVQQYFVTSCGHVLCKRCAQTTTQQKSCPVCKKSMNKLMPLDNKTPPEITKHFKPDCTLPLVKINEFQNKQQDQYIAFLKKQVTSGEKKYIDLKQAYDEMIKQRARLLQYIETTKAERSASCVDVSHSGSSIMNNIRKNNCDRNLPSFPFNQFNSSNERRSDSRGAPDRTLFSVISGGRDGRPPRERTASSTGSRNNANTFPRRGLY